MNGVFAKRVALRIYDPNAIGVVSAWRDDHPVDGPETVQIPATLQVLLRCRVEGVRKLERRPKIEIEQGILGAETVDLENGTVAFACRAAPGVDGVDVKMGVRVSLRGYQTVFAELPISSTDDPHVVGVDFRAAPQLTVRVVPPRDNYYGVRLEHKVQDDWRGTASGKTKTENRILFSNLEPGIYRLLEVQSRLRSDEFFVASQPADQEQTFDLTSTGDLSGQIHLPDGYHAMDGRVRLVTKDGTVFGTARPKRDGTFRIRTDGITPYEIRAHHPLLAPHPTLGRAKVLTPRGNIQLHLVPGNEIRLELFARNPITNDLIPHKATKRGTRVELFPAAGTGSAINTFRRCEGSLVRIGSFEPGVYHLQVKVSGFAPLVWPNLSLTAGLNDLGRATLTRGSTLKIRLLSAGVEETLAIVVHRKADGRRVFDGGFVGKEDANYDIKNLVAGEYTVSIANAFEGMAFDKTERDFIDRGRRRPPRAEHTLTQQSIRVDGLADKDITIDVSK